MVFIFMLGACVSIDIHKNIENKKIFVNLLFPGQENEDKKPLIHQSKMVISSHLNIRLHPQLSNKSSCIINACSPLVPLEAIIILYKFPALNLDTNYEKCYIPNYANPQKSMPICSWTTSIHYKCKKVKSQIWWKLGAAVTVRSLNLPLNWREWVYPKTGFKLTI